MAVTAVNGAGTQTDVTIARKYHKKGTNTYYLYDAQGNRYKVGQGLYNKTQIGGTVNSSQLPFNRKVKFQTPAATNPVSLSHDLESAQNQLRAMQQQFTSNTTAGYGEWLNSRIGQPVAQEYTSPFSASLSNTQPKAVAQWNGKITYNGIEYPNLAEFRRFNPEVQIQPLTPVTSVAPSVTAPIEQSPGLAGRSAEDIQKQQRALFMEEQGTPKVTMQKIKEGPNKGKFGVFVNGKLQENQVFDSKNAASKARIEIEKKVNDPVSRAARRTAQADEAWARQISRYGSNTKFDHTNGEWISSNRIIGSNARDFERTLISEAEMDALQPYQRDLKTKPQVVETPVVPEQPVIPEGQRPIAPEQPVVPEGQTHVTPETPSARKPYSVPDTKVGPASQEVKSALEAEAKGAAEAGSKSFLRQHGGKMLFAGLLLAGVATLLNLSKCEGEKQQLPPVEPEKKPEPKPQPEKPDQPAQPEQNQEQQPENTEISVVKGSHEWGYAELELISEHLGQAGYRPTNQEITDRMMQIIERENKTLEDAKADDPEGKNRHSIPTLNEGDMLNVSPKLKKLIDEATKELKEAHKDNPNYKVTWTELRAKVQEKLAA